MTWWVVLSGLILLAGFALLVGSFFWMQHRPVYPASPPTAHYLMPMDLNQTAHGIVQAATKQASPPLPPRDRPTDHLAAARGRRGGLVRADRLTTQQRIEAARHAARSRWDSTPQ